MIFKDVDSCCRNNEIASQLGETLKHVLKKDMKNNKTVINIIFTRI